MKEFKQRIVPLPEWADIRLKIDEDNKNQSVSILYNSDGYEVVFVINVASLTEELEQETIEWIIQVVANIFHVKEKKLGNN